MRPLCARKIFFATDTTIAHLTADEGRELPGMSDADDRLRNLLDDDPPASVAALGEADKAALADVLDYALRRQDESVMTAFTAALKHVPFPLRKVVKKVLMG